MIDPLDEKATSLQGRGTRVTLRAAPGGEALADFILGEAVPDRQGLRYVRLPGKNRTYAAEVDLDLSTRFSDWIDTDLLDVTTADATRLSYDTRKINPDEVGANGGYVVRPGDPIVLTKADGASSSDWTMADLGADREVDSTKVSDVVRAVDALKIIGVRPLPRSRNAILRSLVSKGFYPTQQGDLLSNEGSLDVSTDEGIVYTLRFGEVTLASGEALTAGVGEDRDESAEAEEPDDDAADDQTEGRYLLVSVAFDPALLPDDDADDTDRLPDDVFARAKDDPNRVEADKKLAEEAERKSSDRRRSHRGRRGEGRRAEPPVRELVLRRPRRRLPQGRRLPRRFPQGPRRGGFRPRRRRPAFLRSLRRPAPRPEHPGPRRAARVTPA